MVWREKKELCVVCFSGLLLSSRHADGRHKKQTISRLRSSAPNMYVPNITETTFPTKNRKGGKFAR